MPTIAELDAQLAEVQSANAEKQARVDEVASALAPRYDTEDLTPISDGGTIADLEYRLQASKESNNLLDASFGVVQGATFAFGDEIAESLGYENYSRDLDIARQRSPWLVGAGEVAGSIPWFAVPGANYVRGVQAGRAAITAAKVNRYGKPLHGAARDAKLRKTLGLKPGQTPSLWQRTGIRAEGSKVGRALTGDTALIATEGAVYSGLYGAGEENTFEGALQYALVGGLFGAGLGGLGRIVPIPFRVGKKGWDALWHGRVKNQVIEEGRAAVQPFLTSLQARARTSNFNQKNTFLAPSVDDIRTTLSYRNEEAFRHFDAAIVPGTGKPLSVGTRKVEAAIEAEGSISNITKGELLNELLQRDPTIGGRFSAAAKFDKILRDEGVSAGARKKILNALDDDIEDAIGTLDLDWQDAYWARKQIDQDVRAAQTDEIVGRTLATPEGAEAFAKRLSNGEVLPKEVGIYLNALKANTRRIRLRGLEGTDITNPPNLRSKEGKGLVAAANRIAKQQEDITLARIQGNITANALDNPTAFLSNLTDREHAAAYQQIFGEHYPQFVQMLEVEQSVQAISKMKNSKLGTKLAVDSAVTAIGATVGGPLGAFSGLFASTLFTQGFNTFVRATIGNVFNKTAKNPEAHRAYRRYISDPNNPDFGDKWKEELWKMM